jgi:type III secretion protein J
MKLSISPIRATLLSLLLSMLLAACNNRGTELLSRLSEDEANTIISILARSDIPSNKETAKDGTSTIYVAGAQQAKALSKLHQRGLPRKSYTNLGEIFKKDGIISSPLEEQARYVYALAQELEDTLSQLDDVVYVRVHPVLARKASLSGPAAHASAGVLITHRPDVDLTPMIGQIQNLVAHSIPDLDVSRVSVVLAVSEEIPQTDDFGGGIAPVESLSHSWATLLAVVISVMLAAGGYLFWRSKNQALNQALNQPTNQAGSQTEKPAGSAPMPAESDMLALRD